MTRPTLVTLAAVGALGVAPAAVAAPAADARAAAIRTYVLPGAAVYPEGIAYEPSRRSFYVSSTTDGTIFRGRLGGGSAQVWLPPGTDGRSTAIGLKVDDRRGRLYVAGGSTGGIWVYDTDTKALLARFSNGKPAAQTFVNDIAVTRGGTAYATDSLSPVLYRITNRPGRRIRYEQWLCFEGTPLQYTPGFNVNGIAATPDGRTLLVVQSNTGFLFRIDVATKRVTRVALDGLITAGDGLLLEGRTLFVVRNALGRIERIRLSRNLTSGTVRAVIEDPTFAFPTTVARARRNLLVVNSQFDKRQSGTPVLPFTVSEVNPRGRPPAG
ncbi:MAG: Superoxide dismutase [Cu-Zn] precursor [uncultured Thermoleophilia bacterium]|uniref:Superoxide dismutase [Cu-Zn] n=1 Tax=uncultured Thermoleophilia bacterium TaxID=1497501 RepID=A0A6J4UC83_9ACTN|nr:MAG: Superoxide dismutase [Cu-Zn] precursor [uncultured Thermoleophilia bacterium]